jgi:hypothetical protein
MYATLLKTALENLPHCPSHRLVGGTRASQDVKTLDVDAQQIISKGEELG